MSEPLSIAQCATLACLLEVTASKPGNVHRGADFEDVGYPDFLFSGVAIGPVMATAAARGVGPAVLEAVNATRSLVGSNTNLGIILLFGPLAAAADAQGRARASGAAEENLGEAVDSLRESLRRVLATLTPDDAACVFEAIRLANPGGLGEAAELDVCGAPPTDLKLAMALAAERDLVARQYVNDFAQVFGLADQIHRALQSGKPLPAAIVRSHIQLMADEPDSLIARKCGLPTARESAARAARVLAAAEQGQDLYWQAIGDLDFWLRSDGHRRNPGTTADVVSASLFVNLLTGAIRPPLRWRDSRETGNESTVAAGVL